MAKHRAYRISDHALVRYIERVRGVNLDHVRREIEAQVRVAEGHDAGAVIVGGFRYALANGVVVTVHPHGDRARRTGRATGEDGRDE